MASEKYEIERRRHFDPTNSTVVNFDEFKDELAEIFAHGISPTSLIQMAGAPNGSTLTLFSVDEEYIPPGPSDASNKGEITPRGLMVKVANDAYLTEPNCVTFYKESRNMRGVYINLVMFQRGKATAIGGLMVQTILHGIESLGEGAKAFKRLRLMAAGGRVWGDMKSGGRWGGYKSWPKYGFDMELGDVTLDMVPAFTKFPKNLARCKTVSSLLALKGGREFWEVVGDGLYMTFELGRTTARKRLEDELQRRFP